MTINKEAKIKNYTDSSIQSRFSDCSDNASGHSLSSNHSAYSFTDLSTISPFTTYSESEEWESLHEQKFLIKLQQRLNNVIQALKNYDLQEDGKILSSKLHNVLQVFCGPLSLKDFHVFIKKNHLDDNGLVKYVPFLCDLLPNNKDLHKFLKACKKKEDVSNFNTEELEIKIKQKISRNIKNVIRAIWMYDYNKDGLIQKEELRTIIENYCFPLSDDQFEKFWLLFDTKKVGVIDYKEFLLKLGTHAESYKRYMPKDILSKMLTSSSPFRTVYSRPEQVQRRYARQGRDDPAVQGKPFTSIIEIFKDKVRKNAPLLLHAFKMKDGSQCGYVTTSVFHQTLNYFVMPMSSQLFKQIMTKLQISSMDTRIPWYEFLKSVCVQIDIKYIKDNLSSQLKDHKWNSCCILIDKLRKQGKNPENFFKNSFTISSHNTRIVTRAELKRTINQALVFPMSEEEFRRLMFLLDPGHTNLIECQSFLSLFNKVPMTDHVEVQNVSDANNLTCTDEDHNLTGTKLKDALRKKFNKNFKNIDKAFFTIDSEETSTINVADLRKILEVFCFTLNDSQFNEILSDFPITGSRIAYNDFLKFYRKNPFEDEEKWAHCVKRLISDSNVPRRDCDMINLVEHVKEAVRAHKQSFEDEFRAQDYCSIGIARKETVLRLLNKYVFRLSFKQFERLWNLLPRNEIGFLKYREFLKEWGDSKHRNMCSQQLLTLHPSPDRRNQSLMARKASSSRHSYINENRPKTASLLISPRTKNSSLSSRSRCHRPKSASSNVSSCSSKSRSLANLSTSRGYRIDNFLVEGKALDGRSVLTKQQYKQYKSLDFETSKELPDLIADDTMNQNKQPTKVKQTNSLMSKQIKSSIPAEENKLPKTVMLTENKRQLQSVIRGRWRDILRRCKAEDKENNDAILKEKLKDILAMTGISITEHIEDMLQNELAKGSLTINYWDFLQQFLLFLDCRPSNENFLRKQLPKRRCSVSLGKESTGLYKALLICRDKILKNFRSIRHCFHMADPQHSGKVTALEFQNVLSYFKMRLSEDEFFFIQDYFDQGLTGSINYNEFLRVFVEE